MKKNNRILVIVSLCLSTACNFSKSVSKDLMTGLSTTGDGLSANEVYISDGTNQLTDNAFVYGQVVYTNFENVDGFKVENGNIYPEMEVVVVTKAGDTVLQNSNLLGGKAIAALSANLNGNVILAAPIYSGTEYILKYTIRDTRGEGVFYSELELEIEKDPMVKLTENGLTLKEAYIFDRKSQTVVTSGEIFFENEVMIDLQGLNGYTPMNGNPSLGMSVLVTDAKGKLFLDLPDLLKGRFLTDAQIQKGLASTLKIAKGELANPIDWQVKVWDKNGDGEITVNAKVEVK